MDEITPIEEAKKLNEELKTQIEEIKKQKEELQKITAEAILGGRTEAGSKQEKPKDPIEKAREDGRKFADSFFRK